MLNYLIFEDFSGQEVPFLFPLKVDHQDMREQLPYSKVVSGGQVGVEAHTYICGGSCSINGVKPRPHEDEHLIAASLGDL